MSVLIFRAYPANDPDTPLGTLTDAVGKAVTVEDNGMGSGSFRINRHSSQYAWCAPGNYIKVWRDTVAGNAIAGFWIDEEPSDVIVSQEEEGGEEATRGGRGPMAVLDEALVWHRAVRRGNGHVETRRGRWRWGVGPGDIQLVRPLIRLLEEAKARGCIPMVDWDFTRTHDSDGGAWTDETEVGKFAVTIGVTLLEVVTILRAAELDIVMDAGFRLHAWSEYVNDLTDTVVFTKGENIRGSVTRTRTRRRMRSVALVGGDRHENKDGGGGGERYRAVRNAGFETTLGRRKEGFKDYGRVAKPAALERVGRRSLKRWKRRHDGPLTLPVIDTGGQVALVDYTVGDRVTIDIPGDYDEEPARISSISLVETESGEYDPILEFTSP